MSFISPFSAAWLRRRGASAALAILSGLGLSALPLPLPGMASPMDSAAKPVGTTGDLDDLGAPEDPADSPPSASSPRTARVELPRAFLIEPAGLAVLPLLSYGLGFTHSLAPWLGERARPWTLRARYARGGANLGSHQATSELTMLDLTWTFYRTLYLGTGVALRNVRTDMRANTHVPGTDHAATSVTRGAIAFSIGLREDMGTYVLGADIVGALHPIGGRKRRGVGFEAYERDPHVKTLRRAANGPSYSALRVYVGPQF